MTPQNVSVQIIIITIIIIIILFVKNSNNNHNNNNNNNELQKHPPVTTWTSWHYFFNVFILSSEFCNLAIQATKTIKFDLIDLRRV